MSHRRFKPPIHARILTSLLLATAGLLAIPADEADAQAQARRAQGTLQRGSGTMSRSAGTMNRSAGAMQRGDTARRGSDVVRRRPGFEAAMSSDRAATNASDERTRGDVNEDDRSSDTTRPADGRRERESGPRPDRGEASGASERDEEDTPDFGTRTLGRACMYGARGEVIFRPRGSVCRGGSGASEKTARPGPAAADAPGTREVDRKEARSRLRRVRPQTTSERPRGSCIYGRDGRVLHAPAGADCGRD